MEATPQQFEQAMAPLTEANKKVVQPHKYANWLVTLLLLVFPPAAFYFMWRDATYHKWFVWMSWFLGGFLVVYFLFANYFLVPRINTLVSAASAPQISFGFIEWVSVFGLGIAQFVVGFVLRMQLKKAGKISTLWLVIAVALLLIDYLAPTVMYSKIVGSVYSSMGAIGL